MASNFLDLIVYLTITGRNYIINYGTLLESLTKSTREYKDILKNKKSNGSLQSKVCKMLKSSKDFGTTTNTKTSILK